MTIYGTPPEIVPLMLEKISQGEGFWLTVTGNSMFPTLKHLQDRVYIAPLDRKVRKWDILLTQWGGKHCLLHRVIKCNGDWLYYKGDALKKREGPLPTSEVIGIVTMIDHGGKIIPVTNFYHYRCLLGANRHQLINFFIRNGKRARNFFASF